ncbi:MAG TPA: FRG domain-containing protein [Phycisphaerae bacterium]|nr:FRG domain-containing protein [Phycisphaerae bacterium]
MCVLQTKIRCWDEFLRIIEPHLEKCRQNKRMDYLYRGQEPPAKDSKWTLKPSLLRCFPDNTAPDEMRTRQMRTLEDEAFRTFKAKAHLFPVPGIPWESPNCPIDWWPFMQHYRVPTRLLDWTFSPYVGLYFAVRNLYENDGELWFFDKEVLKAPFEKAHNGQTPTEWLEQPFEASMARKASEGPRIYGLFSFKHTERLHAQQGAFTLCNDITLDHDKAIEELMGDPKQGSPLEKYLIDSKLKPEILVRLQQMNITGASLSPGMDGLGMSIAERLRVDSRSSPG